MAGTDQPSHRTMVDAATSINFFFSSPPLFFFQQYSRAGYNDDGLCAGSGTNTCGGGDGETKKKRNEKERGPDTPKIAIQVPTSLPYRLPFSENMSDYEMEGDATSSSGG